MFPDSWAPVVTSDSPRVGNMGRSLGTRCMSLLSSSPSLWVFLVTRVTGLKTPRTHSLEMKEREDVCLETDPCIHPLRRQGFLGSKIHRFGDQEPTVYLADGISFEGNRCMQPPEEKNYEKVDPRCRFLDNPLLGVLRDP